MLLEFQISNKYGCGVVTYATRQAGIERGEEGGQSSLRDVSRLVSVAEPLQRRDGDHPIKGPGLKREAVPHVVLHQVTFYPSFSCYLKH